ncbi:hypothetical protein JCM8547_002686 [Rhodosporidiobolus lusitaniae]
MSASSSRHPLLPFPRSNSRADKANRNASWNREFALSRNVSLLPDADATTLAAFTASLPKAQRAFFVRLSSAQQQDLLKRDFEVVKWRRQWTKAFEGLWELPSAARKERQDWGKAVETHIEALKEEQSREWKDAVERLQAKDRAAAEATAAGQREAQETASERALRPYPSQPPLLSPPASSGSFWSHFPLARRSSFGFS